MAHFIEFKDVTKIYGTGEAEVRALDGIRFYVDEGEFCVLLGSSGAGKTTLLNMLGGMDRVTFGEIWFDGREVSAFSKKQLVTYRRKDVGFVFQFYNLIPNLTALENVEIAAMLCEHPIPAAHAINYGLTSFPEAEQNHLHGEIVSFGVLILLLVESQVNPAFKEQYKEMAAFSADVGLPRWLDDLGLTDADEDRVIDCAIKMKDIDHNPYPITREMVTKAFDTLKGDYRK